MAKVHKIDTGSLTANLTKHGMQFLGFSDIMPNPDPILKNLGWGKDIEAYSELLSDPQLYGAIENNRKPGVKSLLRYLDNDKTPKAEMEFFTNYFDSLLKTGLYDNITSHALDTPYYGRMVMGIVWGDVDGYFLPVQISPMPLRHCKFNYDGELLVSDVMGSFKPPEHPARFITLKHKPTVDNPYGEALLSKCYWNVLFKKEGRKLWAMYVEKFGMPWVAGSYNAMAMANTFGTNNVSEVGQLFLDELSSMARDGVIVFPDGANVNLMNGDSKSSTEVYERLVRICDEQNTKLILGHSGATESTSGDKLSNDTTATDVRKSIIDADKKFPIVFWNELISWIHYFNFPGSERPIFDLYAKEDVDMQYADRDAKLAPVLMQSGKKLSKNYFVKTYGFDESDIEDNDDASQPMINASQRALFVNESKPKYKDQELIDELSDDSVAGSKSTEEILADVIEKVNNIEGFDELKNEIGEMLAKIDTDNFQENVTNILFLADVIGRLSAKSENEV